MIGGIWASAKVKALPVLRRWLRAEEGRFILWLPVFLIIGIALYFSSKDEPILWPTCVVMALSAGLWAMAVRFYHAAVVLFAKILFFVILGFLLAQFRTLHVSSPIIPNETVSVRIEGVLLKVDQRPTSQRFLLVPSKIGGLAPEHMPARIRLTWRGEASIARPGDVIAFRGVVAPPPEPTMPGGYDYGRQLFFERIGGVGFAVSQPQPVWRPQKRPLTNKIEDWRLQIATRIMEKASPDAAPVLAAVVTGLRAQIPEETTNQLRDTGLAHLLAISGLHMGLVCGFLFVGLRTILLWVPGRLGEAYPIKKWAAIGALLGGLIYLAMSGGAWSAQRAYIMAAISFVAVLLDRRAISLRNVAIAAILILCLKPEAALSAGFQMSFGAVMALVAAYEAWRRWKYNHPYAVYRWRPLQLFGGVFFTSFVAGMATSPFAIYHFGRIANYGLVANLAVMPLFTVGVMPIAILGLMAMPFGLDAPFWWVSSQAFDLLLLVTEHIADWRGAVILVPQWPVGAWLLLTGSMIFLCLSNAPWRLLSLIGLPITLLCASLSPSPVIVISEGARNVAWRDPSSGEVYLLNRQRERFATQTWLEAYGLVPDRSAVQKFGPCKEDACTLSTKGGPVVYAENLSHALVHCEQAALIITPAWGGGHDLSSCRDRLVTGRELSEYGPSVLLHQNGGLVLKTVRDSRGTRPWTP